MRHVAWPAPYQTIRHVPAAYETELPNDRDPTVDQGVHDRDFITVVEQVPAAMTADEAGAARYNYSAWACSLPVHARIAAVAEPVRAGRVRPSN